MCGPVFLRLGLEEVEPSLPIRRARILAVIAAVDVGFCWHLSHGKGPMIPSNALTTVVNVTGYREEGYWEVLFNQAVAAQFPPRVLLSSQIPGLFELAAVAFGQFDSAFTSVDSDFTSGFPVVLEHSATLETYRELRDLVRFVDDRLAGV